MKRGHITSIGLILLMLIPAVITAQQWKREKADKYYNEYLYVKAAPLYETLKDKTPEVYRKLADCYYHMGKFDKSAKTYKELLSKGGYGAEDIYQYAYYLMMNGQQSEAVKWMEKYAKMKPGDSRAKRFLSDPGYYSKLQKAGQDVSLKNVSVNSKNSDFGPSYYKDKYVVFTSARGFGRLWNGNMQPYLDLFKSTIGKDGDLQEAERFFGEVNKKYHDGPAAFSKDGKIMIVTRNMYNQQTQDNRLWLYESNHKEDGTWTVPKALSFNGKDYSCGHATLSPDGNTMYFASDMPGGYGKSDIYVTHRKSDGGWIKPENLGPVVNTEGDEKFPYYDSEGNYLFFASDGLPGLGGLDEFVVKLSDGNKMTDPVNLGSPINGPYDDFSLIYKSDNSGYFASNRPGGKGDDDIYTFGNLKDFKQKAVLYSVGGLITDKDSGKPLPGAKVTLYDASGKVVGSTVADASGQYEFTDLPNPAGYRLSVEVPEYKGSEGVISDADITGPDVVKNFALARNIPAYCKMQISPLYYDLDKYFIRDQYKPKLDSIAAMMQKYPDMRLWIGSHTDSRATEKYNEKLSHNRAEAVVKYLTSKGIDASRLDVHWFGESQPVNGCVDGVKCTEEQYQLNRRTEFRVICPKQ